MVINKEVLAYQVALICIAEGYNEVIIFINQLEEIGGIAIYYTETYIDKEMCKKIHAKAPLYIFDIEFEISLEEDLEHSWFVFKSIKHLIEVLCDSNKKIAQADINPASMFQIFKGGKINQTFYILQYKNRPELSQRTVFYLVNAYKLFC